MLAPQWSSVSIPVGRKIGDLLTLDLASPLGASSHDVLEHVMIKSLPNTAIIAEFRGILKVAKAYQSP